MAYFPPNNNKLMLTQPELAALLGTSQPSGDKQINSIKGALIRGKTLSITDNSYLYGPVVTDLIIDKQITTTPGKNLVLNPSGPSVDFTNHTLINVAGISSNPNRYEVIAPAFVITTDATPTVVLSIATLLGYSYNVTVDVTAADYTDGVSSGTIILTGKSKNTAGVAVSTLPYVSYQKSGDAPISTITGYFTDSGANMQVIITGVAATNIRWFAAARVTRSQF